LHLIYIYIFSALFQLTKTILIVLDLVSDIFNESEYFVFESGHYYLSVLHSDLSYEFTGVLWTSFMGTFWSFKTCYYIKKERPPHYTRV